MNLEKFTSLIFISFVLLNISTVHANLFIVLLQSSHVLPGLRELSLLHTLSNIPVDEGSLGVHQIKLVIQSSPGLGDGGGVGEHADSSLHLGQVSSRDNSWRLVVDTNLESSGTPVNKLDGPLGLDGGNGSIDILGDHVSSVEHAASHVLTSS